MKCIICVTVFSGVIDKIKSYRDHLFKIIETELKYTVVKHNMGIHRETERTHSHLTFICNTDKSKVYKILNDKIKRTNTWKSIKGAEEFKDKSTIPKLSFRWETDSDYCETKALAYNLKEYTSYEIMMDDYKFYEAINIDVKEELEELRKYGNSKYLISKEKHNKHLEKKNLKKNMYDYLSERIKLDNHQFYIPDPNMLTSDKQMIASANIRYIAKNILVYCKDNEKTFSVGHLKNQAINYLYNQNYITEEEILSYANI